MFYQSPSGEVDIYADGGLVVNYPIFAFDGNLQRRIQAPVNIKDEAYMSL